MLYNVVGMTQSGIEPSTFHSRGTHSITKPPLRILFSIEASDAAPTADNDVVTAAVADTDADDHNNDVVGNLIHIGK